MHGLAYRILQVSMHGLAYPSCRSVLGMLGLAYRTASYRLVFMGWRTAWKLEAEEEPDIADPLARRSICARRPSPLGLCRLARAPLQHTSR